MVYPQTYEQKLGFDRIREMLYEYCLCRLGQIRVEQMEFTDITDQIRAGLELTHEMLGILRFSENLPQENYIDCTDTLKKITAEGSFPDTEEVNNLRKSILTLKELSRFFQSELIKEKYPFISAEFSKLMVFPSVGDAIDKIMDKHGVIRDNASQELRDIRIRIKEKSSAVGRKLQSILKKARLDGLVDPDVEISVRDGRPVIPIAAGNKRKLGGIVHDESASGKTAYVEPQEVVELNNELRELGYAERREIVRILIEFADNVRPSIPEMLTTYDELGRVDFIRAKAKLAIRINAVKPILHANRLFEWKRAVHPLLYLTHLKYRKEIVPLDLTLDEKQRILLISGPNAGGKSVCLKTVGLIQYMLQCGMLVPMSENSEVCVFSKIFLDIGDEQSLENDLSTYSSHLLSMKYFVRNASPSSLVLIDEFGTGTEPALGGAIAEAILAELNSKEVFGVITTHYANLKHFASETPGIVNGAMLFDTQKIQPLYRLSMGEPGSSFAIDIARSIGLPETILSKATEIVGEEYVNFEKHLREIIRDKKYWEEKRMKIRQVEKTLGKLYSNYQNELEALQSERKNILKQARSDAESLLNNANKTIERTIREIKESNAEKEQTRIAREKLQEQKHALINASADDAKTGSKLREIQNAEKRLYKHNPELELQTRTRKQVKVTHGGEKIEIGDRVRIKGLDTIGDVIEINGDEYIVTFGNMLTTIESGKVEKYSAAGSSGKNKIRTIINTNFKERKFSFKPEIDIRGKRADEALNIVRDFLDDALMMNAKHLSILHGKGNGILRQLIREYLETLSEVQHVTDAHADRGGAGITLIELR